MLELTFLELLSWSIFKLFPSLIIAIFVWFILVGLIGLIGYHILDWWSRN